MTSFEAVVDYAGKRVKVKSDSFAELHQALSGVEELNRDAAFLKQQGIEDVIPVYRRDGQENEYFGLQDRHSRKNVTYGTKREKGLIPFFPKGEDGYYDPAQRNEAGAPHDAQQNGHATSDRQPAPGSRPRESRSREPRSRRQQAAPPRPSSPDDYGIRTNDLPF